MARSALSAATSEIRDAGNKVHLHDRSSYNMSCRAAEIHLFPISLRPCHPAHPSTAENIRSFGCPARPRNTVGDLVVNRRSLYDRHLSVRCSEATADEICSTACGKLEDDSLPAVTGAAVVSLELCFKLVRCVALAIPPVPLRSIVHQHPAASPAA